MAYGTVQYNLQHWQIPLGRRFRSLKLWFVMRIVGIDNLRKRIREDMQLAKFHETIVLADERFEVVFPVTLGLVCFRLITYRDDIQVSPKSFRLVVLLEKVLS